MENMVAVSDWLWAVAMSLGKVTLALLIIWVCIATLARILPGVFKALIGQKPTGKTRNKDQR